MSVIKKKNKVQQRNKTKERDLEHSLLGNCPTEINKEYYMFFCFYYVIRSLFFPKRHLLKECFCLKTINAIVNRECGDWCSKTLCGKV